MYGDIKNKLILIEDSNDRMEKLGSGTAAAELEKDCFLNNIEPTACRYFDACWACIDRYAWAEVPVHSFGCWLDKRNDGYCPKVTKHSQIMLTSEALDLVKKESDEEGGGSNSQTGKTETLPLWTKQKSKKGTFTFRSPPKDQKKKMAHKIDKIVDKNIAAAFNPNF